MCVSELTVCQIIPVVFIRMRIGEHSFPTFYAKEGLGLAPLWRTAEGSRIYFHLSSISLVTNVEFFVWFLRVTAAITVALFRTSLVTGVIVQNNECGLHLRCWLHLWVRACRPLIGFGKWPHCYKTVLCLKGESQRPFNVCLLLLVYNEKYKTLPVVLKSQVYCSFWFLRVFFQGGSCLLVPKIYFAFVENSFSH